MTTFSNKLVTFDECITIRYYECDIIEDCEAKKGKDWQRTSDLIRREFKQPIEKGGCGGNWNVLQSKLDELTEPWWYLVGQLWFNLYKCAKRIEESSSDEDDELHDIIISGEPSAHAANK